MSQFSQWCEDNLLGVLGAMLFVWLVWAWFRKFSPEMWYTDDEYFHDRNHRPGSQEDQ